METLFRKYSEMSQWQTERARFSFSYVFDNIRVASPAKTGADQDVFVAIQIDIKNRFSESRTIH